MFSIHDEGRLTSLLEGRGHKRFRYSQIENALYKNHITDFDTIETLPKEIRELLKQNCFYSSLSVHSSVTDTEGQTTKFLLKTHDERMIEMVIMRHRSGRNTLCISSQVGCPMGCSFCATGKMWLIRNLEFSEIIDEVMIAILFLMKEDRILRNIVFMGMGEPLINYGNVKQSIAIMCDQKKLDFSSRRVTVSTCGIVPWILKLAEDFPQVSLAISLHAPNDTARRKIMPVEDTYPLDVLMEALDTYVEKTNKRIFFEYIMISWVTDRLEYIGELASLLKGRLAHVNFIPYNPGDGFLGSGYEPSHPIIIEKFQAWLEKVGIPSTIRHTMGDDIDAACGQLALRENGKSHITEMGKTLWKEMKK